VRLTSGSRKTSSKCLSRGATLAEVTTAFFADDCRSGYRLEMESPSWNDLDSQEKRSVRAKFYTMKRCVRLVLLHAESHPLMPEDPTKHKEVIKRIATEACECLQDAMGEKRKAITPGRLEKLLAKEENKNIEKREASREHPRRHAQVFLIQIDNLVSLNF